MLRAFSIQTIRAGDGCCTVAAYQCFPTAALFRLLQKILIARHAPALAMPLCRCGVAENAYRIYVSHTRRCLCMLSRMTIGSGARSFSSVMPVERLIGCLLLVASAGSRSGSAADLPRAALLNLQKTFARRESTATRSSSHSRQLRCLG